MFTKVWSHYHLHWYNQGWGAYKNCIFLGPSSDILKPEFLGDIPRITYFATNCSCRFLIKILYQDSLPTVGYDPLNVITISPGCFQGYRVSLNLITSAGQ